MTKLAAVLLLAVGASSAFAQAAGACAGTPPPPAASQQPPAADAKPPADAKAGDAKPADTKADPKADPKADQKPQDKPPAQPVPPPPPPVVDPALMAAQMGVPWPDFMSMQNFIDRLAPMTSISAPTKGVNKLPRVDDVRKLLFSDCPFGEGVDGIDSSWIDKIGK
jgi:hypothetical protein